MSESTDKTEEKPAVTYAVDKPVEEKTKEEEFADDYGYPASEEEKPQEEKAEEEKPVEEIKPATGYDKEPEAVVAKSEEKPDEKPDKKPEGKAVDTKDLIDVDAAKVNEFAKKHSVEAAQDMAEMFRAEYKEIEESKDARIAANAKKKLEVEASWRQELKDDPQFGGDKFMHNVNRVDKVMNDFLPLLKARLLKSETMLPPDIMKDLAGLANHLYSTERLTQGNPVSDDDKDKENEVDSHLNFYT